MKRLHGKVVSTKMAKTIVVEIAREWMHPLYKKRLRRTKRYKAHYEGSDIQIGDQVTIRETKPISKDKQYRVDQNI